MESNAKNKSKFLSIFLSMVLALVITSLLFVLLVSHKEATEYTYKRLFDKSALEPKQNYPDYKVLQRESLFSKQTITGQVSKIIKEDNGYIFNLTQPDKENLDVFIPNKANIEIKRQICDLDKSCEYIIQYMENIEYKGMTVLSYSENINKLENIGIENIKTFDSIFIEITKRIDGEEESNPNYLIIVRSLSIE